MRESDESLGLAAVEGVGLVEDVDGFGVAVRDCEKNMSFVGWDRVLHLHESAGKEKR